MKRKREKLIGRGIWVLAVFFTLSALSVAAHAVLVPPGGGPPRITKGPAAAKLEGRRSEPQDVVMLARRKMSKAIVKPVVAPPAPPPKPPAPPLETVVRLAGIMDFGAGVPKEAFIETRAGGRTKAYKAGDAIEGPSAVVKAVTDTVLVEYDGKLWRLSQRGAELVASADPPGIPGKKE
jgi:hypothetical protein